MQKNANSNDTSIIMATTTNNTAASNATSRRTSSGRKMVQLPAGIAAAFLVNTDVRVYYLHEPAAAASARPDDNNNNEKRSSQPISKDDDTDEDSNSSSALMSAGYVGRVLKVNKLFVEKTPKGRVKDIVVIAEVGYADGTSTEEELLLSKVWSGGEESDTNNTNKAGVASGATGNKAFLELIDAPEDAWCFPTSANNVSLIFQHLLRTAVNDYIQAESELPPPAASLDIFTNNEAGSASSVVGDNVSSSMTAAAVLRRPSVLSRSKKVMAFFMVVMLFVASVLGCWWGGAFVVPTCDADRRDGGVPCEWQCMERMGLAVLAKMWRVAAHAPEACARLVLDVVESVAAI